MLENAKQSMPGVELGRTKKKLTQKKLTNYNLNKDFKKSDLVMEVINFIEKI